MNVALLGAHASYTTIDLVTIQIAVTKVTDGKNGPLVQTTTQTIDEAITRGAGQTEVSKIVYAPQTSTSTQPTAEQVAALASGKSGLDEDVTISDRSETIQADYANGASGSAQLVNLVKVSSGTKAISSHQGLSLDGSGPDPAAALASATQTYSNIAALKDILAWNA